jgi:hypothetical protein
MRAMGECMCLLQNGAPRVDVYTHSETCETGVGEEIPCVLASTGRYKIMTRHLLLGKHDEIENEV